MSYFHLQTLCLAWWLAAAPGAVWFLFHRKHSLPVTCPIRLHQLVVSTWYKRTSNSTQAPGFWRSMSCVLQYELFGVWRNILCWHFRPICFPWLFKSFLFFRCRQAISSLCSRMYCPYFKNKTDHLQTPQSPELTATYPVHYFQKTARMSVSKIPSFPTFPVLPSWLLHSLLIILQTVSKDD